MPREIPRYSSGSLSIDPVTPADLPVFRELLGELVELLDMKDVYAVTDDVLRSAMFVESPREEAIIARYNGEVAGLAIWAEAFHVIRGKNTMVFDYIYVRPKFRSHMITPAILIYLLVLARRRGYFRMEGFVHDWNTETAGFYRSLDAEENTQASFHLDLDRVDWAPFSSLLEADSSRGTE